MNLNFNELLARAFLDLPDEVDLVPVVQSTGDPTRYSTIGLYDFIDGIANQYIGTPDEIMLSNLWGVAWRSGLCDPYKNV